MLDSIYIGTTGLTSFSEGLSNISNNVANLNTPGFKGSQLEFLDLFYRHQYSGTMSSQGSGVETGATVLDFSDGEFRQNGNDLNAAIDGNGFFVLRKDGEIYYTRAGQFEIDEAGFLVASTDGARVAGLQGNAFADISVAGKRSNPPKATQLLSFTNTLSTTSSTFDVQNITVFDSLGVEHTLTLKLTNDSANTPGRWTFELQENSTTLSSGEIKYGGDGSPIAGSEKHSFSYAPGNGAQPTQLTLDFSDSTYFSTASSTLKVDKQDGYAAGFLSGIALDSEGKLVLSYSNGQTLKEDRLALAWFDNLAALQSQGGNRYTVYGETSRILGQPGTNGMGKLQTGGIELSNVDLAKEFSELILLQRGYQASSQVITTANEMIQQLGEIRGRR
jgi:flagellar hook protein FlgE